MMKSAEENHVGLMPKRHTSLFLLLILALILAFVFVLAGFKTMIKPRSESLLKNEAIGLSYENTFEEEPVISQLNKSFLEIKNVLGEPDEEGHSNWLGPHTYLLYQYEEGYVRYCSPDSLENPTAVSIVLGPGQEVNGAKVGQDFHEIKDVLGEPDYGPEMGMDNLYYMEYFESDTNEQVPYILVSFVASSIDSRTEQALIKKEDLPN